MFDRTPSPDHQPAPDQADQPEAAALPGAQLPPGQTTQDRPVYGMAAALAAFFMLSAMSLFAKLLSETHHVIEIAFWRNLLGLIPFVVMIVLFGRRDILRVQSAPKVVITRSVVATLSVISLFGAFSLLPLADATALVFTSALFVPVFGFFFLGERVGRFRWTAVFVGFLGVLILARPTGDWNAAGLALALAAAVLNATLATMLRFLGRTEQPLTLTFYLLAVGLVLVAPFMPFLATMPRADEIGLLVGLGVSGILMQIFLSTAFKYAPAALASLFSYTQIIWATLFGWAIFSVLPDTHILLGAAIIIASSIVVVLRERYLARSGRLPRPAAGEA
jgi:drug/metabolite transporter (DMT)-like permease